MDVLGKLSVQALPIKQVLDQCGFSKDAADITTTFLTTPTGLAQTM